MQLQISRDRMKKFGIWLLAIFLFLTHVFIRTAYAEETEISKAQIATKTKSSEGWQEIYAQSGDCRISFPGTPKLIQQSMNVSQEGHKLTYDIYLAPLKESALCLLLVAQYPYPLKKGHELAGVQGLLKGIVGHSPDNQLIFAEVIERNGHSAIDFLVQSSSSFFRGQAMMVGTKLFLIAIEGKKGELDETAFGKFAESFALVP